MVPDFAVGDDPFYSLKVTGKTAMEIGGGLYIS
jgi:hypothetical protein